MTGASGREVGARAAGAAGAAAGAAAVATAIATAVATTIATAVTAAIAAVPATIAAAIDTARWRRRRSIDLAARRRRSIDLAAAATVIATAAPVIAATRHRTNDCRTEQRRSKEEAKCFGLGRNGGGECERCRGHDGYPA